MGDGEEKMSPFRPQKCVLCTGTDTHTHTHTQTETDRQTDRQTNRQTDRQTGRQAGRQAGRQKDRQTLVYLLFKGNKQDICLTILLLFKILIHFQKAQ